MIYFIMAIAILAPLFVICVEFWKVCEWTRPKGPFRAPRYIEDALAACLDKDGGNSVKAVVCPACNGKGTVPDDVPAGMTSPTEKTCRGCLGKGWVEIGKSPAGAMYELYTAQEMTRGWTELGKIFNGDGPHEK